MGIRNLSLAVAMPPEIRNNMLGRFSTMGAANDRDGIYSPEIIEELVAFLILALKHPEVVINFAHLELLATLFGIALLPATDAAHRHSSGNRNYWRAISDALEISVNLSITV